MGLLRLVMYRWCRFIILLFRKIFERGIGFKIIGLIVYWGGIFFFFILVKDIKGIYKCFILLIFIINRRCFIFI